MIPDISVIVTTYNCKDYVAECLGSILNQKGISLEVICVDDCSNDTTREIIKKIVKENTDVRFIANESNVGPASSRNVGLRAAKGRYICFVDGDDLLREGSLNRITEVMDTYSLDLLSYTGISFSKEKEFKDNIIEKEYFLKNTYPDIMNGVNLFENLIENGDKIRNCVFNCMSREFILRESLQFKDGLRYADDNMLWFLLKAERVLYTNEVHYYRRYRTGSTVTSKKTSAHLESFINSFVDDLEHWNSIDYPACFDINMEKYLNRKYLDILAIYNILDQTDVEAFSPKGITGYIYRYLIRNNCMYGYLLSETDKQRILHKNKIFIYGAKDNALKISCLLESWGISDYTYVTSNKELVCGGKYSESFFELICDEKIEFSDCIFIISTSSIYHAEIERLMIENSLEYCMINV